MSSSRPDRSQAGFFLLEALLAVLILSAIAVSLTQALTRLGQAAGESRRHMSAMRTLNSLMTKELRQPVILPYRNTLPPDEYGVSYETMVEEMTGNQQLQTREGQPLAEMFRIRIRASWQKGRELQEEVVETYRYARLYRNNGGGGGVPVAGQLPTGRPGPGGGNPPNGGGGNPGGGPGGAGGGPPGGGRGR